MKGRLLIFCGIPGSGKTTIARIVAEKIPRSILIQTDAVREMLGHPNYGADESRFVYDGCMAVARQALRNGYTVLLDGTFMREEYRSKAKDVLHRNYSRVDVVYVACGLETALRRNSSRRAHVPADKVRSIHRRFEAPKEAIRIDSTRVRPGDASNLLVEMLF
jgi:predicted kinase